MLAICFIKAVFGQEKAVFHALKEVDGVKSLYHIFGDHDIFMVLESEGIHSLRRTLLNIEEMDSINAVRTLLVEPDGKWSIDPGCRKKPLCSAG